jgi:hypothetical protein
MRKALVASLLPFALAGCSGAFVGNLVVLAITVGIFVGTLSLGRSTDSTRSGDRSSSTRS